MVETVLRQTLRLAGTAVGIVLAAMVAVTVVQVALRFSLGGGLYWAEEFARYCFVWIIFLGSAVAFDQGMHIGVDMLTAKAAPRLRRALAIMVEILIIGFCATVVYASIPVLMVNSFQISPGLEVRMSAIYAAIPVSMTLIAVLSIWRIARIRAGDPEAILGQHGAEL